MHFKINSHALSVMLGAELSKFRGGPVLTLTLYRTALHSLSIEQVERVADVIKLVIIPWMNVRVTLLKD